MQSELVPSVVYGWISVQILKSLHIVMTDNHIISVRNIRPDGYPSVDIGTS